MSNTDYMEHELLKWQTGQANALDDGLITPYIGAFTAAPSDSTAGTEASYAGYARVSAASKWAAPASSQVASNAQVLFAANTSGSSVTIVALGLFNASTSGNLLRYQVLDTPLIVANGDQINLPSGSIVFTES